MAARRTSELIGMLKSQLAFIYLRLVRKVGKEAYSPYPSILMVVQRTGGAHFSKRCLALIVVATTADSDLIHPPSLYL